MIVNPNDHSFQCVQKWTLQKHTASFIFMDECHNGQERILNHERVFCLQHPVRKRMDECLSKREAWKSSTTPEHFLDPQQYFGIKSVLLTTKFFAKQFWSPPLLRLTIGSYLSFSRLASQVCELTFSGIKQHHGHHVWMYGKALACLRMRSFCRLQALDY